ncbi:MAG TPA: hypothetical protein H9666_00275 [Firmicutes bacterium]|nr:hypothetical protein [Bacillota bacterium]
MKNNSRNAPPLIKGALALAGFFLVIWGGFHLWQWYKLRPLEAALDTFTADTPFTFSPACGSFQPISSQEFPLSVRQMIAATLQDRSGPFIDDISKYSGGWQFHYTAPQGEVTFYSSLASLRQKDGTVISASYQSLDWDRAKAYQNAIFAVVDARAVRRQEDQAKP